ncbi:MAG: PilZ domain-containing protein, partial [Rhodospirillales bacterium]|nr:PilZ domain-containing protein [Rhodospirillales bacterium]
MASVKGFVEKNDRIDNRRPLNETYLVMEGGTCEVIDVSMGGISFAGPKENFPLGKNV